MVNYSQKSLLGDYLYRSVLNVKSEGHPSSEISWSLGCNLLLLQLEGTLDILMLKPFPNMGMF